MSYLDQHLLAGEQVVYRAKLHWIVYRWAFFWAVLGTSLLFEANTRGAAAVFFLLAFIAAAAAFIAMNTSEFGVTTKRVIIKIGLIRRHSLETLLTKVEGVGVDQSIVGRMRGYGTIFVTGTGGSKEPFRRIAAPFEFMKQVQEQIGVSTTPSPAAPQR